MAQRLVDIYVTLQDHEGEKSTVRAYFAADDQDTIETTTANVGDIVAAIYTASEAHMTEWSWVVRTFNGFALPAMAVYGDSEDKAYFEFRSQNTGQVYALSVPAPKAELFAADNETVDPNDAQAANVIITVTTIGASKSADTDLQYIKGYRLRKKSRKERPGYSTAQG